MMAQGDGGDVAVSASEAGMTSTTPPPHVHRYALPTQATEHILKGVCACGAEREYPSNYDDLLMATNRRNFNVAGHYSAMALRPKKRKKDEQKRSHKKKEVA
jgi:hypothetical protein